MDLKEKREKVQQELQSKWNELNDLEQRKQVIMNEILMLQGKLAMLDELIQESEQEKIVLGGGEVKNAV
jgi:predicted  nucleic acid-binding Zn-ribbon protein